MLCAGGARRGPPGPLDRPCRPLRVLRGRGGQETPAKGTQSGGSVAVRLLEDAAQRPDAAGTDGLAEEVGELLLGGPATGARQLVEPRPGEHAVRVQHALDLVHARLAMRARRLLRPSL